MGILSGNHLVNYVFLTGFTGLLGLSFIATVNKLLRMGTTPLLLHVLIIMRRIILVWEWVGQGAISIDRKHHLYFRVPSYQYPGLRLTCATATTSMKPGSTTKRMA
jgi:hypothetical protein